MTLRARPLPDPAAPGQESVWAFPRPARAEPSLAHVRIEHRGRAVADSRRAVRVVETSHPPSWYLPLADVSPGVLRRAPGGSLCEWKGRAAFWDAVVDGEVLHGAAWGYPDPTPAFAALRGHAAFYAAPFDLCTVDGEPVRPQPGRFYGGWITGALAGPFKGEPGSEWW